MTFVNNPGYLAPVIAIPSALEISAISRAFPCVITASPNSDQTNTYIPGQLIRLNVPRSFGMWQIDGKTVQITAVSGSNITVPLDSTNYDAFVIPASTAEQPASLSPAGSRNLTLGNNTIQVPFQNLSNTGN